jgi:hypothetical protein
VGPTQRHPRIWRVLPIVLVLAAGVAAGWLVGGGEKAAQAAEPVQFTPAASVEADAFTPPADIKGLVTIKSAKAPFGGSGSNFVCDREKLVNFLSERPDHLRAWARVEAIPAGDDEVAAYIRDLRPATLLEPTRVTTHTFVHGKAIGSQAILEGGTAVLVDEQGAIRTRCRTGAPLLDPILSSSETCKSCPSNYRPPSSVKLAQSYYAVHPAPPVTRGEKNPPPAPTKPVTVEVIRQLPPESEYVVQTVTNGKRLTVTQERVKTVTTPGKTKTVKVKVKSPAKTTTVTRTVTVQNTVTVPRTETVHQTVTVYEGAG